MDFLATITDGSFYPDLHNIFMLNSCVMVDLFVKLPGVYVPSVLMANAIGTNTEIYARDKITGTICILDTPMRSPP